MGCGSSNSAASEGPSKKPVVIFVLGGPGSGKRTQCDKLVNDYQFTHISTGDLIREQIKKGGSDGEKLESLTKEGKLVPSELLVTIIKNYLDTQSWKGIYLLDGFPRNQENIDCWKSIIGDKVDTKFVLYFDCAINVMKTRLINRGKTSGRSDDNEESIEKRLKTFEDQTKPILSVYKDKIVKINTERDESSIYEEIKKVFLSKVITRKPKVVFVLGGPGSGKGTQCARVKDQFNFIHLSTGDLLREEAKSGSAVAQEIAKLQAEGKLASSEILVKLVMKQFTKNQWSGKYLLDGFPRGQDNINAWNSMIGNKAELAFLLFIECSFECMEKRLLERGKTSGRSDDNAETIKKRFDTFTNETKPILAIYEKEGKVQKINSERDVDVVYGDVKLAFCKKGLDK